MIFNEKRLQALVKQQVREVLEDENIQRRIAMEYLVGLKRSNLTRFLEAVELRRQSDDKLAKLDKTDPDVDHISETIDELKET